MTKWRFYPAAVVLAVIALFLCGLGHEKSVQAMLLRSSHLAAAYRAHVTYVPDPEVARLNHVSDIITLVGLSFALAGIVSMIVARVRREKGWYLIPGGLLLASIFVGMLLF